MGTCYGWASRADVIEHTNRLADGYTLVDTATVGSNHWQLIRTRNGRQFITLALLKRYKGEHGYKALDESMGPCEVNCPLRFIDAVDGDGETGTPFGYAEEWRAKVRAYHAARKAAPKPAEGLRIVLGSTAYTLSHSAGPRRGWIAYCENGNRWRIPAARLSSALRQLAKATS